MTLQEEKSKLEKELEQTDNLFDSLEIRDRILEIDRQLGIQSEACDINDPECESCSG